MAETSETLPPVGLSHFAGRQLGVEGRSPVIGIYGIPGSGKTHLLHQLRSEVKRSDFVFFEGSDLIASTISGGLEAFQQLPEHEKVHHRQQAIETVEKTSTEGPNASVIAGHFMFLDNDAQFGAPVWSESDSRAYTHIIYLEIPAEIIAQRIQDDDTRQRSTVSIKVLREWQAEERRQLCGLCRQSGILFIAISDSTKLKERVFSLLRSFKYQAETSNDSLAKFALQDSLQKHPRLENFLILDGDKTLSALDTGDLFWQKASHLQSGRFEADTLSALFNSQLGYSKMAFQQAALLYEEIAEYCSFDDLCYEVARAVHMYPEFVSLLQVVTQQAHVRAMVLTCGLGKIWKQILQLEGLSGKVQVIGNGRLDNGFVITPTVKGTLTAHIREHLSCRIWAFGDSPLDIHMLAKADHAIVVVGDRQSRSKTMDHALAKLINLEHATIQQTLIPNHVPMRLDVMKLPVVKVYDPEFIRLLLANKLTHNVPWVLCGGDDSTAKVLATPMRDAAVAGPQLRDAHRKVGWYLAMRSVTNIIGLEQMPIQHVLGRPTHGYRLLHEAQTTIVALMRGGEPMASGVSDAFPLALFLHAHEEADVKTHHLTGQLTMILVDSVINTGKSIVEFVKRIRVLHATIRIVIVAGVVQADCLSTGALKACMNREPNVQLAALRTSDTKFTGAGGTDTGNRLFNTTRLP